MEEHDLFFQRIIGLIPKELYKSAEEEEDESMNNRYFKHRLQPLQASERKLLSKKRKLEKYGIAEDGESEGDDVEEQDGKKGKAGTDEVDDEHIDTLAGEGTVSGKNLPADPRARLRVRMR